MKLAGIVTWCRPVYGQIFFRPMWGMANKLEQQSPTTTRGDMAAVRLAAVRAQFARHGLGGYLVPRSDEYLGEYVPAGAERLSWLTGFTGSNGLAVVLADHAIVLTDPRYSIQVKNETDRRLYATSDRSQHPDGIKEWLQKVGAQGVTIGFDPRLHGIADIRNRRAQLEGLGIALRPVDENLIDTIWHDQPDIPHTGVESFLEAYAGLTSTDKRLMIGEQLQKSGVVAAFLSDPTDLAWLLNIRARDLAYTPIAFSRGLIYADGTVEWFIDPLRVSLEIRRNLGNAVNIVPPENMPDSIMRLKAKAGRDKVLVDERMTNYALAQMLEDRNIALQLGESPIIKPRAIKTVAEQNAIKDAHRKDAAAIVRFLAWFSDEAPHGRLDELGAVDKLLSFRKQDPAFRSQSFDTIAGYAANGAIVHYHVTPKTNKRITGNGLLLMDSGAQYVGGTTDITRVLLMGEATDDMCTHYTAVLKSHIAVARAVFPVGAVGSFIDAVARGPLWRQGLDFGHRVGHGVGCYLSVHEPAADLSAKSQDELKLGMVLSNEPGYYRDDHYGIRLESLVIVTPMGRVLADGRDVLGFETITLVPFDPSLTKLSMLDADEKLWLSTYHQHVINEIGPLVDPATRAWLGTVCTYFMV